MADGSTAKGWVKEDGFILSPELWLMGRMVVWKGFVSDDGAWRIADCSTSKGLT
jgi:hypothetical protein